MKRRIEKVAVLGSGVMGSRIACHFANIGCEVVLLDIVPEDAQDSDDPAKRNKIVNDALKAALKSNPSPIYSKSRRFTDRIRMGNYQDDLELLKDCDWVIEAVVERLDIKNKVFDQVERVRKNGTLITTNTSGIPIESMLEGRSDDFRRHFFATHFFNPPRYLKLLEIIPSTETDQSVIDFMMDYGERFLGKTTVLCKDTPAFIANRIGVYSIQSLFHQVEDMGLTVEEVDKLTGPVLGRPKSATFRTCDVVGLDTLVHVANGVKENCPNDESNELFEAPGYVKKMVDNKWLGAKSGQGFYKKVKDDKGKSRILALDLETMEYNPKSKVRFATLDQTKPIDDLTERIPVLFAGKDKAGEFYRKMFFGLFSYVSNRIPEISDEIYKVDDAMIAGFGWELGPFEYWDVLGVEKMVAKMKEAGREVASWVTEMIASGATSFYKVEEGKKLFYDQNAKAYKPVPGQEDKVSLEILKHTNIIWENDDASIVDLGDGILNVEFHTKMNTIGGGVISAIRKAIDLAEAEHKGVVIYNEGQNFSAGANVGMIFMFAVEQEWEELDFAIRTFQNTMMRIRYSSVPVVVAPHNMALGGGCEMSMHADAVVAHAELYMGLVEFGVGLIPGGGGTKEFALRLSDELMEGNIRTNQFRNRFLTVGQAKVSTSAEEAFELGYLRRGKDFVVLSRDYQLAKAKEVCLGMANAGYTRPTERKDITVLGKEGLGLTYSGANSMKSGHYMSEHDEVISLKLGNVLSGGDLSQPTEVSEQYLLNLERRAFLELCRERKTLERIESILKTGKVLRN